MAQRRTAQHGGFHYPLGDAGGTDRWNEYLAAGTDTGHSGAGPDFWPRHEDRRDSAPTRSEAAGSGTAVRFGIAEWTPYRRPWYRKTNAIAVIGAVVAIAVIAVALVVGRGGSGAGDETRPVAPAATTGSPSAAPPRSAGTPQTALLPPAPPPPPSAEQMSPPPVVTRQWPRYEAPTQANPPAPKVSAPPSMSFAPKPVTPPQTAAPGTNKGGHHGFF